MSIKVVMVPISSAACAAIGQLRDHAPALLDTAALPGGQQGTGEDHAAVLAPAVVASYTKRIKNVG